MQNFRWIGERKLVRTESPLYRFTYTNIAANETKSQDLLYTAPYSKYAPFNFFQIVNNSDLDMIVKLGENTLLSPKGSVRSVDDESIKAFYNFQITNNNATNSVGIVEVLVQKTISDNALLRKLVMK